MTDDRERARKLCAEAQRKWNGNGRHDAYCLCNYGASIISEVRAEAAVRCANAPAMPGVSHESRLICDECRTRLVAAAREAGRREMAADAVTLLRNMVGDMERALIEPAARIEGLNNCVHHRSLVECPECKHWAAKPSPAEPTPSAPARKRNPLVHDPCDECGVCLECKPHDHQPTGETPNEEGR